VESGKSTMGKMWNDSAEKFHKLLVADFPHFTITLMIDHHEVNFTRNALIATVNNS